MYYATLTFDPLNVLSSIFGSENLVHFPHAFNARLYLRHGRQMFARELTSQRLPGQRMIRRGAHSSRDSQTTYLS